LSAPQLLEWEAFFSLEPFGDDWRRTALLSSVIANANRDPEQRPESYSPDDFMPVVLPELSPDDDDDAPWKQWKTMFSMMAKDP
jgi:hypothetical protein